MKSKRAVYFFYSVVILASINGCWAQDSTTLYFENKSTVEIDSVVWVINNFKGQIFNLTPTKTQSVKIEGGNIKLNKHDVTVRVYFYSKNSVVAWTYWHNDLSGALYDKYTALLDGNLKAKIVAY